MDKIKRLANFISESKSIVVFTGAGISTESGISDYRSKGGIWERFQPVTFQEFLASEAKRKEYWRTKFQLYETMREAQPNDGHKAIVAIEQLGKLKGLIMQNIDGLHQMAGTSPEKIIELHGTNRETVCLSCGELRAWQEVYERLKQGEAAPQCRKCRGLLKPNTISFGQALDVKVLEHAIDWVRDCDCLLAVGSTLIVEPAASIPRLAKRNGAKLAIITISETPLDDSVDLVINAAIGATLNAALKLIPTSS